MTRLRDVAVLFASSVVLAQDPQYMLNGGTSGLLTTPLGTQASTLGSCLMDSACQRVGKKITLDDIVISTDSQGNTKCCPQGTTFNGNSCVYPKSTVCPPDMHFANGVCVLTSGPVCEDKNLVPTKDGCASKVPPTCPPETVLDNGQCVLKKEPTCPGGKKIVNGLCTIDQVPKCPEKGFRAQGNLCVSEDGPTCQQDWLKVVDGKCVHIKQPSCPPGTKPTGTGRCMSEQPPICPPGFTVSGNTCRHDLGPSCPTGSTFQNGVCVYSRTPSCSNGKLINGQCVADSLPGCPSGFKFEPTAARCQRRDQLNCQAGYVNRWDRVSDKIACCPKDFGGFDGTFCTKDNPSGSCPPNSEPRDNKCVTSPGSQPDCDGGKGFVEKGVCFKKEEASCPSPSKLSKDKCIYETDPHCTDGKLSPSRMECIIDGPDCPPDSIVVDDECVSNQFTPECPKGLKQKDGYCVGEPTISCPPGTTRNGEYCIYENVQPGCKDGLLLLGTQCVTRITAKCPENTMPEGEYCVSMENPFCPPDYTYSLDRRACVHKFRPACVAPFRLVNGRCVVEGLPACPPYTVRSGDSCITSPNCSGDYTLVGDRCVSNKGPVCDEPSTEFDDKTGQCISRRETPTCSTGVFLNGKCVLQANCPPNTTPMGDYCVSYQKPACQTGFTLENGECVLKKGPSCPPGFTAQGTECYSIKKPVCPPDSIMDGDRCIIGVNPDCIILGTCPEIA